MIDCCVNMFHVEYNRIATETQEVMASKVKEAIQNEQQYEDTEIEHMFDDLLGDTPEANFVKETITKEIIKNRKKGNIMTGTETTRHLQTNTIPQELATKETPRSTNEEGMDLMQMVAQVVREHGIGDAGNFMSCVDGTGPAAGTVDVTLLVFTSFCPTNDDCINDSRFSTFSLIN